MMTIENFSREQIGVVDQYNQERLKGFKNVIDNLSKIINGLSKREGVIESSKKNPERKRLEWHNLDTAEKNARLDLIKDICAEPDLDNLKEMWYKLKQGTLEIADTGDFEGIQRDVLTTVAIIRLIKELGLLVYATNPILDREHPNSIWVDPNQQKNIQNRDRVWAVSVQVEPNKFAPEQFIFVKNEKPAFITSEDQQKWQFAVREIQFFFGDKDNAILKMIDPTTGNWINQKAKELYLNEMKKKLFLK